MYNTNIHQPTSSYDNIVAAWSRMKLLSCLESVFIVLDRREKIYVRIKLFKLDKKLSELVIQSEYIQIGMASSKNWIEVN